MTMTDRPSLDDIDLTNLAFTDGVTFIFPAGTTLAPGGRLLVKSDHDDYSAVIAEILGAASGFTSIDPEEAFADLPQTGFEEKYLVDGRMIHSFALRKEG